MGFIVRVSVTQLTFKNCVKNILLTDTETQLHKNANTD